MFEAIQYPEERVEAAWMHTMSQRHHGTIDICADGIQCSGIRFEFWHDGPDCAPAYELSGGTLPSGADVPPGMLDGIRYAYHPQVLRAIYQYIFRA